ncbi:cingulin [Syngnathus typhle]|uniref:cingulin n=1 Tax=Syngnathus typhle TaxID=161592 RepID=UPI002A6A5A7A|nr:cingulin [Syngnathus typhle]XP_061145269.1 cingulin [Syngnathus typhle]
MNTSSSGRRTPVDHGVQIRFINDLRDSRGQPGSQPKPKSQSSSKYGVAVRVQGIAGQPYVVLKDGKKGDSYGVQLRTQDNSGYSSLPRRKERGELAAQEVDDGGGLRRAQSQGSLLDRDGEGGAGHQEFQLSRPPGDGKSGSYGNLDSGLGVRGEREAAHHTWEGSRVNGSAGSQSERRNFSSPPRQAPAANRFDHGRGGRQQMASSPSRDPSPPRQAPTANRFDHGRGGRQQMASSPSRDSRAAVNHYASNQGSPGRGQNAPAHSPHQQPSAGRYVAVETEPRVTPDLLLDQSAEMSREEEQIMQTIYRILREGTNESDVTIKHKVKIICQRIQNLRHKDASLDSMREKRELERKVAELQSALREERRGSLGRSDKALKDELDSCLDANLQLEETLARKKKELHETQSELTQLRIERENAEARSRTMEDQLSELQDELRRENINRTDVATMEAEMLDVCHLKQKLEETLRQRERELTALKGALKGEVATHDKEIEELREQYNADVEKLRSSMEQVSQSHAGIEAERLRINSSVRTLQQQLEDCRDESSHWMEQFHNTRDELRSTKQELLQTRLEKEESEEELKEVQDKVNAMKQKMPDRNQTQTLNQELERRSADLQKAKSDLEKQKTESDKKVMEMIAVKKAHQEQEAELKYEIDRLKNQLQRAKDDYAKAQEKNKKLPDPATLSELEQKLSETQTEASQLKEKLSSAEDELEASKARLSRSQADLKSLEDAQKEQTESQTRLKEKMSRLEAQLLTSNAQSSEAELALHNEVRGLRTELDEAKRKASRLTQEHRELSQRADDAEKEKEALKQNVSHVEEIRQQQARALEKINKEFESLTASSRGEVQSLKVQLEEQRERARKEMHEVQRHGSDAQTELDRSQTNLRRLEEELSRQKKELLLACEERDNHQLDKEMLTNRLRHLEGAVEAGKNGLNEKTREIRILEDKLKRFELDLEEERSSTEMLTERVSRSRDQIEQLRAELMQERSAKQDLELDKNSMERHLKELRGRLADMEGQSRSSAGASQLESKIQELEEQLRTEDREKNSILASQRRLERKLKELNMVMDEERETHTNQKDQLTLKVKALKRQVDEGETELERIDTLRRKAQRDMEEQTELKEALQARVTALETELKRKTTASMRPALDSSALSSDDDSVYESSSIIAAILTDSNLQTSAC